MIQFSYLPNELTVHYHKGTNFIIGANSPSLPIYFALKNKHEYQMLGTEQFISDIMIIVEQFAMKFDLVVIPESRYGFLKEITKNMSNVLELKKRAKNEICELAQKTQSWKKQDRESAKRSWNEMGESFTINHIKSNKRKDYIPYLFENTTVQNNTKILLLDDFIMSGNTIKAMAMALGNIQYAIFGIFHQNDYQCN